jgi:hypothetical protein
MQTNMLRDVHEGMKVYDAARHEIGRVDWVQFGADDPDTAEIETGAEENLGRTDRTLADLIADAFRADELPEAVRARLLQQGFLRLDADGIFSADRYILPEQIGSVAGDAVTLTVEKSDLMKKH